MMHGVGAPAAYQLPALASPTAGAHTATRASTSNCRATRRRCSLQSNRRRTSARRITKLEARHAMRFGALILVGSRDRPRYQTKKKRSTLAVVVEMIATPE